MLDKEQEQSKISVLKSVVGGIVSVLALSATSVYAVPAIQGVGCGLSTLPAAATDKFFNFSAQAPSTTYTVLSDNTSGAKIGVSTNSSGSEKRACFYQNTIPATVDTTCSTATIELSSTILPNYVALIAYPTGQPSQATYCLYSYDFNSANADPRTNGISLTQAPAITPAAVPIFTPLGILAMMSGLLWFGKRRRKFK